MEQPMHQTQMTMPQHHQQQTALHPNMHMSAAAAAGLAPSGAASGPSGGGHQTGGHPTHHPFLSSPALASPVGSTNNATHPNNPSLAANAPCSTLFVANLGQFVSEHELKEVFSSMPGFCRLRMHTKGTHNITSSTTSTSSTTITSNTTTNQSINSTNTSTSCSTNSPNTLAGAGNINYNDLQQQQQQSYNNYNNATGNVGISSLTSSSTNSNHPVAFIEFKDANTAAAAMQQLQGKYLLSSDRGSIRIEFAKTKMITDSITNQIVNGNHNNNNNNNNNCNNGNGNNNHYNANKIINNAMAVNPTTMTIINPNSNTPQLVILNGYPTTPAGMPSQSQHLMMAPPPPPPPTLQTQFLNCSTQPTVMPVTAVSMATSMVSQPPIPFNNNNNINNNNTINNNNNNNNTTTTIFSNNANIINRSTALPPPPQPPQPTTVVVNSLQHQLHPIQHQNHLFRDRSGYGIKA